MSVEIEDERFERIRSEVWKSLFLRICDGNDELSNDQYSWIDRQAELLTLYLRAKVIAASSEIGRP